MVSINIIYNSLKSNYITDSSGSTGTSSVGKVAGGVSGSIAFAVIVVICAVLAAIGKCSKSTYNFVVNRQQNTSTTTNSRVVTSRSSTSTSSTRTASQPNYSGTTVTYTRKLQDACPPSYTEIHSYPQVQYPPAYPGYETNIAYFVPTATAPVSQVKYDNVTTPVATAANYETPNGQSHQDMSNICPPSPPNYSEICNN